MFICQIIMSNLLILSAKMVFLQTPSPEPFSMSARKEMNVMLHSEDRKLILKAYDKGVRVKAIPYNVT